jgi:hypothetical protein
MNASSVLLLLLILACPLSMVWMMRSGHGHGHGGQEHDADHAHQPPPRETSAEGLRELRAEIDRMIEERESAQQWGYSGAEYSERGYSEREPEPTAGAKR